MENILLNFNIELSIKEILSFFSPEFFIILGVFLNFILFLFFRKKLNVKRISDFITSGILLINSMILGSIYVSNQIFFENVKFGTFNDFIYFDENHILTKFLINIFVLFFIMITYKMTRKKARTKTAITNSILLLSVLSSGLMVQSESAILTYLLLEISILLVYKYASNMRIRKFEPLSSYYMVYGICSTVLVIVFYLLTFRINGPARLSIVQAGLSCAILLKIGLFPIYNYLSDRIYKKNIQFSILQFCFIPMIGVIAFLKILENMNILDETYQVSMFVFLLVSLFAYSLGTLKSKNLIKFLANAMFCFSSISIINALFLNDIDLSLKLNSLCAFCILGVYSLICILRINFNIDKININTLRGIFVNNRFYAILLSLELLFLCGVLPNGITVYAAEVLSNIYLFDKLGVFALCVILFTLMLIIFAVFIIIQNIYSFDKNNPQKKLLKRTALNYAVPLIISLFLIINMFL